MITQCPKTGRTCEITGCSGCWKGSMTQDQGFRPEEIIRMFHEAGELAGWKPGVGNPLVINYLTHFAALAAIRAARAQEQVEREPVKLIYEDELPEDYPYDEMFSRSIIIEGVRMFPEVQTEHSVVNESLTAEDSQIPAFLRRAGSFGD